MLSERLLGGVAALRKRVYRGPVRTVSKKIGVEPLLARWYSKVTSILSRTSSRTINVGETEVSYVHGSIYGAYVDEKEILEALIAALTPSDVFYDIGAAFGLFTLPAAATVERGEVVAFEPSHRIKSLRDNLEANGLSAECEQVALSDRKGTLHLNEINQVVDDPVNGELEVRVVRGDDWVEANTVSPPDVVKIDVEGGEMDVLQGMETALSNARLIFCEVHPALLGDATEDDVTSFLNRLGFEITIFSQRGGTKMLRAERS